MLRVVSLLNEFGRWLVSHLGQMSVELAILAAVVLAALYLLRVRSPKLRHLFWCLVLAKPVATFLIASPVSLYWFLMPEAEAPSAVQAPAILETAGPMAAPRWPYAPVPRAPRPAMTPRTAPPLWQEVDRYGAASLVWLLVAGAFGMRLLMGCAYVGFLRQTAETQRKGPLADLVLEAAQALGMRRRVAIGLTNVAHGPVLAGVIRPVILLPETLAEVLSTEQLKLVVTHELAHARRWDNLVLLMQRLAEMFLFFHPVVWICGWIMRREAEAACDDAVVEAYGEAMPGRAAAAYADSLTRVAEMKCGFTRRLLVNTFAAAESNFTRRVRRILSGRRGRMTVWLTAATAVAMILIGVVGLPTAAVRRDKADAGQDSMSDALAAAGAPAQAAVRPQPTKAKAARNRRKCFITLACGEGGPGNHGRVSVHGREVATWEDLSRVLEKLHAEDPNVAVLVRPHPRVKTNRMTRVLEILRRIGIENAGIAAWPASLDDLGGEWEERKCFIEGELRNQRRLSVRAREVTTLEDLSRILERLHAEGPNTIVKVSADRRATLDRVTRLLELVRAAGIEDCGIAGWPASLTDLGVERQHRKCFITLASGEGGPGNQGRVYFQGREVTTWEDLSRVLERRHAQDPKIMVVVRADPRLASDRMIRVLELVKAAGIENFGIAGRPTSLAEYSGESQQRLLQWANIFGAGLEQCFAGAQRNPGIFDLLDIERSLEPMSEDARRIRRAMTALEPADMAYLAKVQAIVDAVASLDDGALPRDHVRDGELILPKPGWGERIDDVRQHAQALKQWANGIPLARAREAGGVTAEIAEKVYGLLGERDDEKGRLVLIAVETMHAGEADAEDLAELRASPLLAAFADYFEVLDAELWSCERNLRMLLTDIGRLNAVREWHTPDGPVAWADGNPEDEAKTAQAARELQAYLDGHMDEMKPSLGPRDAYKEKEWLLRCLLVYLQDHRSKYYDWYKLEENPMTENASNEGQRAATPSQPAAEARRSAAPVDRQAGGNGTWDSPWSGESHDSGLLSPFGVLRHVSSWRRSPAFTPGSSPRRGAAARSAE